MEAEGTPKEKTLTNSVRSRAAPLIERAPVPIVEVQGESHILTYVNAAFCHLLGKTRGELLGRSFADIVPLGNDCVPILDKVYQTGEAITHAQEDPSDLDPSYWLYAMWPALDEHDRPERVIIQLSKAASLHENAAAINEALLISGLRQHELTEAAETVNEQLRHEIEVRKRAEESNALLASIVDSTADSIVSLNLDATITSWNKAAEKLYGFRADEVLGKSITMLILPKDFQQVLARVDRVKHSQSVELFEMERRHKDGTELHLSVQMSPIKDARGEVIGVSTIARDITERKKIEDALRIATAQISNHAEHLEGEVAERTANLSQSIASLENLTYTMAHDLRAPLRAMKLFTVALLEDTPLDETGKDYAGRINQAAARMDQLVNDLLDYGQLSHLDFPLHTVDLNIQMEKVFTQESQEIQEANAKVRVHGSFPLVRGHEMLLNQVFSNLLLNALKFVPSGIVPKVDFRVETRGPMARIWVEDNGIGIAPHYQANIFGVFQRLHTSEEFPGTGVGLAIVKRAVERMRGTVGVESELGKGSRFWVDLPIAPPVAS